MVYRHGAFDHYDTICAAGPHHVDEIRAIEAKYKLPRKNVIELGYPRLDSLIKTAKTYQKSEPNVNKTKKILIAPSWGSKGLIESGLCKTLVEQLLNLGHEVVLRPHPQTLKFAQPKVDEIRNNHKENMRFTYENCVAGQDSLHQSDIMVSDWSGAALEYAFALNKPVIFCDVPRKVAATLRKNCRCRLLHSSDAVFKCFLLLKTTVQLFRAVFKIPFQMAEVTDIICTEMFQESIRLLHVMNYR